MAFDESTVSHGYADLDDVRLHYVEAGEGPLVVLLHGFPELWLSWHGQIGALADAGFHVVAPDMRGYNLSSKPRSVSAYDVEFLTRDIERLIGHFGERRAHVAGHDWGGGVAWYLGMLRPHAVERLAILNTGHPEAFLRALRRPPQALRSYYMLLFQLPVLPEALLSARRFALLRRFTGLADVVPDLIDRYVEAWSQPYALSGGMNYYRAAFRQMPAAAMRRLAPIEAPVLVIWGERDAYQRPDIAVPEDPERWLPDLRVERLPEASHWVQHEEPERVNRLLIDFFSGSG